MLGSRFSTSGFVHTELLLTAVVISAVAGDPFDCYQRDVFNLRDSKDFHCRPGYSQVSDIFKDDVPQRSNQSLILCCPVWTETDERVGPSNPFFWPNERKGKLTRAFMTCHATSIPGLDTIRFLLYTRKNAGLFDYEELYANDFFTLEHSNFIKDAPLKVIIHGFMSSAFVGPAPALRAAYSKIAEKINILAVHWEALANVVTASDGICYDIATQSTKFVGRKTAQMIEFLVTSNYTKLENVHVLGHSLGSHCAGFVGKSLKIGRLPRLTAFDPARPAFEHRPPVQRLDVSDAEFIDVIHTATKQWRLLGLISFGLLPFPVGIKEPMGHRDFYPNSGTHQPGCVFQLQKLPVLCSHSRSYQYYADSIRYRGERVFLATECSSLAELEKGSCPTDNATAVPMGEYTQMDNSTRKLFYVKTNARSPFPVTVISPPVIS